MTPQEKAKQLCNKFSWEKTENGYKMFQNYDETKRCALIAVDEILDVIDRDMNYQNVYAYFLEVKQEIEKI
jgi:hypothetical protein